MALSWKARHKGKIYCAPACGRGCTYKEYLRSHKLADRLVKKCEKEVGGKWKKYIHENQGWHYSVSLVNGNININEDRKTGTYWIMAYQSCTPSHLCVRQHSKLLKWLVNRQLRVIQKEAALWQNYVDRNKNALGKLK